MYQTAVPYLMTNTQLTFSGQLICQCRTIKNH